MITLADWLHIAARLIQARPSVKFAFASLLRTNHYGNWTLSVIPDATLINGQGRYPGGPESPLSVISVEQGKRCVVVFRFGLNMLAMLTVRQVPVPSAQHCVRAEL